MTNTKDGLPADQDTKLRGLKPRLAARPLTDEQRRYQHYLYILHLQGVSEFRTRVLDDRKHRAYIWISDLSHTLYRFGNGWELYDSWESKWVQCQSDHRSHLYDLYGTNDETFIRLAKDLSRHHPPPAHLIEEDYDA